MAPGDGQRFAIRVHGDGRSESLPAPASLTHARLRSYSPPSCVQLAEALKQAKGLTTLDLGGNAMGPRGVEGLAGALKGHPGLNYLELGCNALGEEGIKSLAAAIKFDVPVSPSRHSEELAFISVHA